MNSVTIIHVGDFKEKYFKDAENEYIKLTVNNNGTIINDGALDNNAGTIDNNGSITGDGEVANENGSIDTMDGSISNPVDNGYKGEVISETTWSDGEGIYFGNLEEAFEAAEDIGEEHEGREVVITLQSSDVSVPENTTLAVPENAVLYILIHIRNRQ